MQIRTLSRHESNEASAQGMNWLADTLVPLLPAQGMATEAD